MPDQAREIPKHYQTIESKHPKVAKLHKELAEAAYGEGPLGAKTAHLIQLAAAVGIRSEGAALSGEAAAGLVSRLHHLFELTVIDAPAVSEEPAVAGLAAMAGGVVLAVKARSTERRELERSVEELESAGARIMGLVLTYLPGPAKTAVGAAALP